LIPLATPSLPRRLARIAQRLVPAPRGPGATVLAYHLVGAGTGSPVDLSEDVFRRQVEELASLAEVVPLGEAVRRLTGPRAGAERPLAVLTFDDAYANFLARAWPVLAELELPATLFVPVGFLDGTHPPPIRGADLPPARWEDLAAAVAGGRLEVGAHSWTHRDLRRLPDGELDRELGAARRRLADRLNVEIEAFCYPRGLWSRRLERRVTDEYAWAAIGGGRRWAPPQSRWRVQRVSLRSDGPASLAPILAAPVWLEEWAADRVRRARAGGGVRRQ
jgi:peptidoglycan/xylan/chitin deacetylase (PgdA/CDA1 family)